MKPDTNIARDYMEYILDNLLAQLVMCMFIPFIYNTVFMVVREKEQRVKEMMRMMGMTDFAYWMSWYVYYTLTTTVSAALATALFNINCLAHSDPLLIFLTFFCYAQAMFG